MKKNVLIAKDIKKSFPSVEGVSNILNGVNLTLEKGKSLAIMGASGEGKTTLLHILGGLETPTSGIVTINDRIITSKNAAEIRNLNIGYIFQTYNLLEDLTAIENIVMPAKIKRDISKKSYSKALDLLQKINLENRKDHLAKSLSGGEKQRVAIARAFCNDPEIILADEPTGNLDHHNSISIHNLLFSFIKDRMKSLIIVTHDKELASMCDNIHILKDGFLK